MSSLCIDNISFTECPQRLDIWPDLARRPVSGVRVTRRSCGPLAGNGRTYRASYLQVMKIWKGCHNIRNWKSLVFMLIFQWHSNLCLHHPSDPETLQDGREGPVYVLQHPFVRAGRHFHQRLHPLFQCTQVQTDHVQEVAPQQRQRLYGGQWWPSGT